MGIVAVRRDLGYAVGSTRQAPAGLRGVQAQLANACQGAAIVSFVNDPLQGPAENAGKFNQIGK
ncbi:MAG: hypothetical protein P4M00_07130 [Azospirillaceae bacterium]|nr:hypothetical protein [Azospirillaceae bacterium]